MRAPKASFLTLEGTRITPACERPSGTLSQKGLDVSDVGRHEHATFGGGQLQDLRVGEPFELYLGVQGSHVVTAFDEGFAHRTSGDVGV